MTAGRRLFTLRTRNGIAQNGVAWSCSCLNIEGGRNKAHGPRDSTVDPPCAAGQNLAWSFRTAMLS